MEKSQKLSFLIQGGNNLPVVVGYSNRKSELKIIMDEIRLSAAKYSDEDWDFNLFSSSVELSNYVKKSQSMDLVCIDINNDIEISIAELIRKSCEQSVILIITDTSVSPTKYMKPSIMAASLLLRPFSKEQVSKTVSDLFKFIGSNKTDNEEDSFVVKSKSKHFFVPYERIVYFEARNKKIYLNTLQKEYGFYDTVEQLIEQLPDYFIRCHRGFVINCRKIEKIAWSENVIYMQSDIIVPLSKSYKPKIRELKAHGKDRKIILS